MVRYLVYQAKFTTRLKKTRLYVGYTKALDVRSVYHKTDPPGWLSCQGKSDVQYKASEKDIPTLEAALAIEALHAARAIACEPHIARGRPWLTTRKPSTAMLDECRAAAALTSLPSLKELADQSPDGMLSRHLKDLIFLKLSDAPGASITRGAHVYRKRKSGPSGVPGVQTRRKQLANNVYKRPEGRFKQLHRGLDVKERRRQETIRREAR